MLEALCKSFINTSSSLLLANVSGFFSLPSFSGIRFFCEKIAGGGPVFFSCTEDGDDSQIFAGGCIPDDGNGNSSGGAAFCFCLLGFLCVEVFCKSANNASKK